MAGSLAAPAATAVHQDSEVVFEKTYVVSGTKTERDFFTTGLPPDGKPLLCYRRLLFPGPFGAWSASVFDGAGDLAIQDAAAWTEVGVDAGAQRAIVVKPRVQPGGWTIDVRAGGFATADVTVAWVQSRPDCFHL